MLGWELAQYDSAVDDVFGFRAVQVGLPEVDFLRQNRIQFRFNLALEPGAALAADPLQLPLASQSVDLIALPHVLEFHPNPHEVLREVERALRPEGQVVISGFNTASLWRMRQIFTFRRKSAPWDANYIGLLRLREWLRLLGFELTGGMFGCYAPPFRSPQWLERFAFMEKAGARWWPIAGDRTFSGMTEGVVEIFGDGACRRNPGPGGWGVIIRLGGNEKELWGGEPATTNNRMELTAVIRGLEALKRPSRVRVFTDSQYVQKGISSWIHSWKRKGWKTADKKAVKNEDLWRHLDELRSQHEVEWHWIKGHAGHPENERADKLANRGIPDDAPGSAGHRDDGA